MDDLLKTLNSYIGLSEIKEQVQSLVNLVKIRKLRSENNLPNNPLSLHMVFTGNPGTGKTMIARLMAQIFCSLDLLSKGQLIEVDRSMLVAGFVGQTAIKTAEVIEKAKGGVLFIDEAYTLSEGGPNDFGQEAINTLLKAMEDFREDLIIIVAGYTQNMDKFIHSNPGLESRFNLFMLFPDYSVDELYDIFLMRAKQNGYNLDPTAEKKLKELLALGALDSESFGNARGVRNLFEHAVSAQADRLSLEKNISKETLMNLLDVDFKL